jgi:hypothetical protein
MSSSGRWQKLFFFGIFVSPPPPPDATADSDNDDVDVDTDRATAGVDFMNQFRT